MSRLNHDLVVERENFVRELFTKNPDLTGSEAQLKLGQKYGKMMRPNRIYELKEEVSKGEASATPTERPAPRKRMGFRTRGRAVELDIEGGRVAFKIGTDANGEAYLKPIFVPFSK